MLRHAIPILAVLAALVAPADAGIARVGRGIMTTSAPPIYYVSPSPDDAGVSRTLYRKQDLAGLPPNVPITAIEYDKRLSGGLATGAFTIYMKNSAATTLPASTTVMDGLAGMTEVFSTTSPAIPGPSGWVRFTLSTPFTYTGDAIEVVTVWDVMSGARPDEPLFATHATQTAFLEQLNYGPDPLAATDSIFRGNPPRRVNTQFLFPDPVPGFLVVEVAKNPLQNGGTFGNPTTFAAGATVPVTYLVSNRGGTALAVAAVLTNVANMPTPTVMGLPPSLAPGGSASVRVEHTPIAANVTTAYTLTFDTDAVDHTITVTGLAAPVPEPEIQIEACDANQERCSLVASTGQIYVGNAAVGEPLQLELAIGNIGSGPLATATGATSLGCSNCTLTFTEQCDASIPAGTDDVVKLAVTPTAVGPWSTTLRVVNDDSTESTYQFQVLGAAVMAAPPPRPDLEVSLGATQVPSGSATMIRPGNTTFTLANVGDDILSIGKVTFESATNVTATVVTPSADAIIGGGVSSLVISTSLPDPSQVGTFRLQIVNDDIDPTDRPYLIDITVTKAPDIEVSVPPFTVFKSADVPVEVRNVGTADLHVTAIKSVVGPSGRITRIDPTSFTIPPGGMQEVMVSVTTDDLTGNFSAILTITSDDPVDPMYAVELVADIDFGPPPQRDADEGCSSCSAGGSIGGRLALSGGVLLLLVRKPRRHRRSTGCSSAR